MKSSNTIRRCTIEENVMHGCTITDCTFAFSDAVIEKRPRLMAIEGNTISGSSGKGIELRGATK